MPFYVDAMIADTLHLSVDEFGAYCLILFATWRNNGQALPDDDRMLAHICRVSGHRWKKLRPRLEGFFKIFDGKWHQKRLELEWSSVEKRIAANRANGLKGGRKANPMGSDWPNPNGTQDEPIHKPYPYYSNQYNSENNTARAREGVPAEAPWAQRCRSWANGHRWNPIDGPAPDEPGCLAPPDLVAEAVRQRKCH